jgi:hypothetical protein
MNHQELHEAAGLALYDGEMEKVANPFKTFRSLSRGVYHYGKGRAQKAIGRAVKENPEGLVHRVFSRGKEDPIRAAKQLYNEGMRVVNKGHQELEDAGRVGKYVQKGLGKLRRNGIKGKQRLAEGKEWFDAYTARTPSWALPVAGTVGLADGLNALRNLRPDTIRDHARQGVLDMSLGDRLQYLTNPEAGAELLRSRINDNELQTGFFPPGLMSQLAARKARNLAGDISAERAADTGALARLGFLLAPREAARRIR